MAVDTLRLYERFSKTGIPDAAAKEIAEAIRETGDEITSQLATKADLQVMELALRRDIESMRSDILRWVAGMLIGQAAIVAAIVKLL